MVQDLKTSNGTCHKNWQSKSMLLYSPPLKATQNKKKKFFFKFIYYLLIIYFLTVLGLRFCARALPSCVKRGPLFIAVRGPPTAAASPIAEHRLQTRRLSSCGSRAQPLRGTRDPPRPGPEPASPAPAGRLPTTAPPGKPKKKFLNKKEMKRKKKTLQRAQCRGITIPTDPPRATTLRHRTSRACGRHF